ncbi:MAG: hypothetical protein U9O98_09035 [Asgard group archaeon]|nr:hypothetical protein [Asgard group archaeon]
MSDKETPVSEADLKGVKLKETSTRAQKADMKLVFKCPECGKIYDWPVHCGEPMELEDDKLVCTDKSCGETAPIPECDGNKCKPFISKA